MFNLIRSVQRILILWKIYILSRFCGQGLFSFCGMSLDLSKSTLLKPLAQFQLNFTWIFLGRTFIRFHEEIWSLQKMGFLGRAIFPPLNIRNSLKKKFFSWTRHLFSAVSKTDSVAYATYNFLRLKFYPFGQIWNFVVGERVKTNIGYHFDFQKSFLSLKQLCYNFIGLLLNPFPHNDTFWRPWETSLLKTLWK